MVVIANLCGPLFTFQTELFTDETVAKLTPVILWISDMMCVVIPCCTAKLGCYLAGFQRIQLLRQTVNIHHYLLTETRR